MMARVVVPIAVVALVAGACGDGAEGGGDDETTTTTTTTAPPPAVEIDVGCLTNLVQAGPAGVLAAIGCNANATPQVTLFAGDGIMVDSAGEAVAAVPECGDIFIFADGEVRVSACSEASQGSTACIVEGTASWVTECAGALLSTPSGLVQVQGTSFSVTYVPRDEITLVAAWEGTVTVAPVDDMTTGNLEEPVEVPPGDMYFTTPDGGRDEVGGVVKRELAPIGALVGVVGDLGIQSTYGNLIARLDASGVDTHGLTDGLGTVSIRAEGARLIDTADLVEVLRIGIEWPERLEVVAGIAPGGVWLLGAAEPTAPSLQWNPEAALALIEESIAIQTGRTLPVVVIVPENDPILLDFAGALIDASFGREFGVGGLLGLNPLIPGLTIVASPEEALDTFSDLTTSGQTAAILLSR